MVEGIRAEVAARGDVEDQAVEGDGSGSGTGVGGQGQGQGQGEASDAIEVGAASAMASSVLASSPIPDDMDED